MEEERKINVSKVIITAVSAVILILIIVLLTRVLTNQKQAAEYNVSESKTSAENVWKIKSADAINTNEVVSNQLENNLNENTVNENTVTENIVLNNAVVENTVSQNTIPENTVNGNETDANTDSNTTVQNNTSENIVANSNQTTNQKTTTNTKVDDKKSNNGVIWLTFDDGPSATITPKVLDILKKENVKATFFVLNYSSSNEHLIKRIVAEGHTIGIHGYSHEYSKIYKSKETFMNNIYSLQDKIYKSTGVKSMYIRFPGGSSNTVSRHYCKGIMTELTKEVLSKGFRYYDWNISSGDAGGAKNAKAVYKNVTKNLSKKRGNLVLCHDIHQKTLEALPDIIKYAKKEGYTFAKIDDNTPMYAQHINN